MRVVHIHSYLSNDSNMRRGGIASLRARCSIGAQLLRHWAASGGVIAGLAMLTCPPIAASGWMRLGVQGVSDKAGMPEANRMTRGEIERTEGGAFSPPLSR